jgi:YhgE/Pip-like protein
VPSWTPHQRTAVARTIAAPVELDMDYHNEVATFGTGFAPFFLPLALFIGTLIVWMLLTPLQSRPIVNGLGALRVVLASYWPALLIVFCQVVVMYAVVHFGVGLQAKYPLATVGFLILVAAAFLALIQMFNAVFGVAVGRVVTLAFLMFQLVSAGGIYPVETTAKPFQVIHPFDPMTYAVNGLRQLTVGGVDARLWIAIAVLTGFSQDRWHSVHGPPDAIGSTPWSDYIRRSRCDQDPASARLRPFWPPDFVRGCTLATGRTACTNSSRGSPGPIRATELRAGRPRGPSGRTRDSRCRGRAGAPR